MGKVVFIIIIIVALGTGLYLYSSGAFANGVKGIDTLFPAPSGMGSSSAGSSSSSSLSSFWNDLGFSGSAHAPIGPSLTPAAPVQQTTITAPSSGAPGNNATAPAINPADIPAGYTAAQLSPYFHDVLFGSVSAASFYSYGTITLNDDDYNSTGTIDITGWQIKSNDGDEYVPQAVNLYDPTGLAPESDINVKTGDTVFIYSSSAPFNLRLNECIGYAAHVANFVPALPLTCPYINQSQLQDFSGVCQNYLDTIGQCQMPVLSGPQVPTNDYACMNYIENNFTYRSCFDQHSEDANFLSNQVWVWTGSSPVNQYHDTVRLLDKNGLLVDIYTY
ncbi:MAG: hypothetical protein ABR884_01600 [Minisyncoccia bacterium]|jgi:hypothetical protein